MDTLSNLKRRPRYAVRLTATIRVSGARLFASVSDLSIDGCCLGTELPIGKWVTVELQRLGELRAQVRWSVNGRSGVRFTAS